MKNKGQKRVSPAQSQASSAKVLNRLTAAIASMAFCTLILSIITLVIGPFFQAYPQYQEGNDNILAKANAGDTDSQITLAHHYYEVGDVSESMYWYKIASADTQGKNYAMAMNNLAFLYLEYEGLPVENSKHYREIERELLTSSAIAGSPEGRKNLYLLLVSTPEQEWTEFDYKDQLARIKQLLVDNDEWVDDYSSYETGWDLVEDTDGIDISSDKDYLVAQIPVGAKPISTESGGVQIITIYETRVYHRRSPSLEVKYSYQYPKNNGFVGENNSHVLLGDSNYN